MRKFLAFFVSFFVFIIVAFIARFIIALSGTFILMIFDIHISESERALRNLESIANIFGVIIGFITALKGYKKMSTKQPGN